MIRAADQKILNEFADRVRAIYPEARIWAFGSRARGDAAPDSDFDICVVIPKADRAAKAQVQDIAWGVGFEPGLLIQALCYSEEEFNYGPRKVSPLMKYIFTEGVAA